MQYQGIAYRAHDARWAWNATLGEGTRRYGGRFNARGIKALYLSLSPLTALFENDPLGRLQPTVVLAVYQVDVENIFDALNSEMCKAEGVTESELSCLTWEKDMDEKKLSDSQALANRLIDAGYAGMRVRSYVRNLAPDHVNLVLWDWGDEDSGQLVLLDDRLHLPKLD